MDSRHGNSGSTSLKERERTPKKQKISPQNSPPASDGDQGAIDGPAPKPKWWDGYKEGDEFGHRLMPLDEDPSSDRKVILYYKIVNGMPYEYAESREPIK